MISSQTIIKKEPAKVMPQKNKPTIAVKTESEDSYKQNKHK